MKKRNIIQRRTLIYCLAIFLAGCVQNPYKPFSERVLGDPDIVQIAPNTYSVIIEGVPERLIPDYGERMALGEAYGYCNSLDKETAICRTNSGRYDAKSKYFIVESVFECRDRNTERPECIE